MRKKGISQEALKLIACIAMLLDHTAAVMVRDYELYLIMRGIGRLAFPIYCFLISEGMAYTRSPGRYALRLGIGALLSELPFDLALFGGVTLLYQNVMITLLLGCCALWAARRSEKLLVKLLICVPFVLGGDLLLTDYGSYGVLMIVFLGLLRDAPLGKWFQMAVIVAFCAWTPSAKVIISGLEVSLELFGAFSMIPICLYHGKKKTTGKVVQWCFYLFYPVHLLVLFLITVI